MPPVVRMSNRLSVLGKNEQNACAVEVVYLRHSGVRMILLEGNTLCITTHGSKPLCLPMFASNWLRKIRTHWCQ